MQPCFLLIALLPSSVLGADRLKGSKLSALSKIAEKVEPPTPKLEPNDIDTILTQTDRNNLPPDVSDGLREKLQQYMEQLNTLQDKVHSNLDEVQGKSNQLGDETEELDKMQKKSSELRKQMQHVAEEIERDRESMNEKSGETSDSIQGFQSRANLEPQKKVEEMENEESSWLKWGLAGAGAAILGGTTFLLIKGKREDPTDVMIEEERNSLVNNQ
ncbi:MAG: hypothetical protein KVP17_000884 [Porospora cf. gigantea B]|uniref:uncharacterized protein n=1 Tax=Porospora cf. gigantea B TaxID=2853592 RepID=UPI003571F874|nr:MAG: hypothetical protein KVP17_000884 [Porospora cf. gigantea B]